MTPRQIAARLCLDNLADLRELRLQLALRALAASQDQEAVKRQLETFRRDEEGI